MTGPGFGSGEGHASWGAAGLSMRSGGAAAAAGGGGGGVRGQGDGITGGANR